MIPRSPSQAQLSPQFCPVSAPTGVKPFFLGIDAHREANRTATPIPRGLTKER